MYYCTMYVLNLCICLFSIIFNLIETKQIHVCRGIGNNILALLQFYLKVPTNPCCIDIEVHEIYLLKGRCYGLNMFRCNKQISDVVDF